MTDIDIMEIFKKQQKLAYLKEQCETKNFSKSPVFSDENPDSSSARFLQDIVLQLHKAQKRQRFQRFCKYFAVSFFIITLALFLYLTYTFSFSKDSETDTSTGVQSLATLAQDEIDKGNYKKAHELLEESFRQYPDNFAGTMTYFNLYQAEKNYDQAAWTLIHYLNDIYGIRNVTETTFAYTSLQAFSGTLSEEMQKKYDECIRQCQKSAGRFQSIQNLIDTKNYTEALTLCNTLKAQNVSDSVLMDYYYKCYTELKDYESCAKYLIAYETALKDSKDELAYLSDHSTISYYAEQIYPYVSQKTQKELDSLI